MAYIEDRGRCTLEKAWDWLQMSETEGSLEVVGGGSVVVLTNWEWASHNPRSLSGPVGREASFMTHKRSIGGKAVE